MDVFDRYNFTVKEDEPLEKEVAVDPEMLGQVFENLLEVKDRKSKGTYYTPREIVHYMCQESLVNYLLNELNAKVNKADLDVLIKFGESVVEHDFRVIRKGCETETYSFKLPESVRKHAKLIDMKLSKIRVCDPAVGSGAFLVGMMNEIVRIRNTLSLYIKCNYSRRSYDLKHHAIQNCLYGVDIDQGAVEIAKLRLWLSLIVDEKDREMIQPLPNLYYKIIQGNSLFTLEKNLFNLSHINQLEKLKPLYFAEIKSYKKQKYKNHIDEIITEITNGYKKFDFEVYFSEIFHEKGGFDVVIANPPYVKEYVNKSAFDGLRKLSSYQGKMDLWYLFVCRGIDILRDESGVLTIIAQNNWVTSAGASKMRNKIVSESQILNLIDFGDFKIFDAGIQTMIMLLKKNVDLESYSFDFRRFFESSPVHKDVISILNNESNPKVEYLTPILERTKFKNSMLTFSSTEIEGVLEKITLSSDFYLDSQTEVAQGIVCPQDKVNKTKLKILGDRFKLGDGVFVLSSTELNTLNLSEEELGIVKPFYTTKELKRWKSNSQNEKWIIYTDSRFNNNKNTNNYYKIKKHLDQFGEIITSDNKPYGLHRARNEYFFKDEKIIVTRKCMRPTFTYVNFDSYVSATFYIIKTERVNQKCLTGILNSKLIQFWLKHRGKKQGINFQIDKEPILSLPLVQVSLSDQNRISNIVEAILTFTTQDGFLDSVDYAVRVRAYENEINKIVYELYGLDNAEIELIEKQSSLENPEQKIVGF